MDEIELMFFSPLSATAVQYGNLIWINIISDKYNIWTILKVPPLLQYFRLWESISICFDDHYYTFLYASCGNAFLLLWFLKYFKCNEKSLTDFNSQPMANCLCIYCCIGYTVCIFNLTVPVKYIKIYLFIGLIIHK